MVYKTSYCFPFKSSLDPRVVQSSKDFNPEVYFRCTVNTSNKRIYGYSIKVLDGQNKIIFPFNSNEDNIKISPLSELRQDTKTLENSGINGTEISIPFIQNRNTIITPSYNCIYYKPSYKVNYIIGTSAMGMSGNDDIANWSSSGNNMLMIEGWDGALNDDLVIVGDTVAVLPDNSSGLSAKAGIYTVQEDGTLYKTVEGNALKSSGVSIVIKQGAYHNSILEWDSVLLAFVSIGEDNKWVDIDDNPINITAEGGNYKWVITLYQGDEYLTDNRIKIYPQKSDFPAEGDAKYLYLAELADVLWEWNGEDYVTSTKIKKNAEYLDFSSQSPEWSDNVLVSGQIMGSTPTRIQFAFKDKSAIAAESVILVKKYIELRNSNRAITNRVAVAGYDSAYGHAYVQEGMFGESMINNASYCSFYKLSNNPEEVEASDQVRCATASNISSLNGLKTIDGVSLVEGDYILVKNQTDAKYNGIYIVHDNADWTRAGSYTTWASFIGKVILVKEGSVNGGLNLASQAQPGGILYNPNSPGGASGDSQLFFSEEQPIVLFPNKITDTVNYYCQTASSLSDTVDGYSIKDGDLVLTESGIYISSVSGGTVSWDLYKSLSPNSYYYIQCGKNFAFYAFKSDSTATSLSLTTDLTRAVVLKNSTTQTYISPFSGLAKGMIIKTNINISFNDGKVQKYIQIKGCNNTVYCVEHDTLASPLKSWDSSDASVPYQYNICSNSMSSDENPFSCYEEPYLRISTNDHGYSNIILTEKLVVQAEHYASKSSFPQKFSSSSTYSVGDLVINTSDDSVYVCTQDVEIAGSFNPDDWEFYRGASVDNSGTVCIADDTGQSWVWDASDEDYILTDPQVEDNGFFLVWSNNDHTARNQFIFPSPSLTAIAQRFVKLEGLYRQWQEASWESYRWVLTDENGNILQDTGKRYDKEMKTTFYGLTKTNKTVYYAILYVEDTLNNSLSLTIKFIVSEESMESVNVPFYAWYDCSSQSVCLQLENMSYVKPSIKLGDNSLSYAYVLGNTYLPSYVMDDSIWYSDNSMMITSKRDYFKYVADYVADLDSSKWNYIVPVVDLYNLDNHLSYSVENGVQYTNYFALSESYSGSSNTLSLLDDNITGFTEGKCYLDTSFVLDDNVCGNFMQFAVEMRSGNALVFTLSLPSDFVANSGVNIDTPNANKNKIYLSITKQYVSGDASDYEYYRGPLKLKSTQDYTYMSNSSISSHLYYLQPSVSMNFRNTTNYYEFLHYTVIVGSGYYPIILTTKSRFDIAKDFYGTLYVKYSGDEYVEAPDFVSYMGLYYYHIEEDLHPWYAVSPSGVAVNSTKPVGLLIHRRNTIVDVSGNVSSLTNYTLTSDDEYNNKNIFSKNAPCYWCDKGLHYKLLMNEPKFNKHNINVVTENYSDGGLEVDDLVWPDENVEDQYYINETPSGDFKGTNGKEYIPQLWVDFCASNLDVKDSNGSYPVKILSAYARHPNQLRNKKYRIVLKVYNIDAFENASSSSVSLTTDDTQDCFNIINIDDVQVATLHLIESVVD